MAKPQSSNLKSQSLRFLFTTDIHGNYFSYDFRTRREGEGSLQRAYAFVKSYRKQYGDDHIVLLDGGDMIQGGPEAYLINHVRTDQPHYVGEMCQQMGYAAGVPGNHDIESGKQAMGRFQETCGYPLIAANITDGNGNRPFPPYVILRRCGMKIAVLGFSTPATKRWLPDELCRGYEFQEILESAREWTEKVRNEEQPDLTVAVLHSGWSGGLYSPAWQENVSHELARSVSDIDIILFGHDHFSRFQTVDNPDGKPVVCLNAGCYGYHIAEAVVTQGDNGEIHVEGQIHDIRNLQNPYVDVFRQQFDGPFRLVDEYTTTPIGKLLTRLDISYAFHGPSRYMSLIHSLQLEVSHADVSLCSPYSVDQVVQEGELTVADLFTVYWFEDRLYTIRLKGQEIKGVLERSYALWTNTVSSPSQPLLNTYMDEQTGKPQFRNLFFCFDTAAGIDYEVDPTQPEGNKITILRFSDGRPFRLGAEYTVATIAHRANGGGQMLTLGAGIPADELPARVVAYTPFDIRHYLRTYIERHSPLSVPLVDNWRFRFPW